MVALDGATGQDGATGSLDGGSSSTALDAAPDQSADSGSTPPTTIGSFVGVNALITDAVSSLAPIGVVREYHNWGWLGNNYNDQPYPQTLYTPNIPDFGWDWDGFFSGLKAMGVSGFPAIQGGVPWVADGGVPPAQGSPTAAASYVSHGEAMFQVAARWGSVKVPDADLKLEPGQTRSSGLGTVEYFEDFNEEDNAKGFTGDVFAAMASADYDGDQLRLGNTIGVKNADPDAEARDGGPLGRVRDRQHLDRTRSPRSSMPRVPGRRRIEAGASPPTSSTYTIATSKARRSPPPRSSPEADMVQSKLAAVVAYRDKNLPGKPVWWTEFGYDTYASSRLHAPALGASSAFIVQGQWLVRELLRGPRAPGSTGPRCSTCRLDDTCTPPAAACDTPVRHGERKLSCRPRLRAQAFLVFSRDVPRSPLQTMTYVGETASGQSDVKIAQFKDTAGPGGALVVWAPTSNATVHAGYALALPAGAASAQAIALVDKQANGQATSLSPTAGSVTLDVSETPTIVLFGP